MTARGAVNVHDALDGAVTAIGAGGSPSPRLDAELLLADALGTTRERLYSDTADVHGPAVRVFQSHVRRRAVGREPVAYILGRRAFRRLELAVDARVLVPRPETELLVELALGLPPGARVLDCCCGSGAVALALKDERPDLRVSGSDLDPGALAVAAANAARLRLEVTWHRSDLLTGLPDTHDAIVANPPYIETATIPTLSPEISRHEPRLALDGGPTGLELITRLIHEAATTSAATLILEHGEGQEHAVATGCRHAGFTHITHHRDLGHITRALQARR
jgi:release factor glutamine methyltransferase